MKTMLKTFICLLIGTHFALAESGGAGNGGDVPRMRFIEMGEKILATHKNGFLSIANTLPEPSVLANYLNINVIHNSDTPLKDNKGNFVSATGVKGRIDLYVGPEIPHLNIESVAKEQRTYRRLVLHEMLRASGINDDNYVYSKKVLATNDSVKGEKYQMGWSNRIEKSIYATLAASFDKSSNYVAESFAGSTSDIMVLDGMEYASLLTFPIKLSQDLKLNSEKNQRQDFKTILRIIPLVDLFAAENSSSEQLKYYKMILVNFLRDLSGKISNSSMIDISSTHQFLQNLVADIQSRQEIVESSCLSQGKKISELENIETKDDLVRKTQILISLIQSNNC
ncbi:MAG: hypothetical protein AB7I27_09835 [Bacteriovoracaceae bacterium]